jgi:hypothetical protein
MPSYHENIKATDLVIRSEPSGSNHFPKAYQLSTKPLIHDPVGDVSYSKHNKVTVNQVII